MSVPGPSTRPYNPADDSEHNDPDSIPSSSTAPTKTYPRQPFASIEYPGSVSYPEAILKVVSQADINECFNSTGLTIEQKTLEMRYKEGDLYAVPVRGLRVPSQKLLLKVTKRRRRTRDHAGMDKGKERDGAEEGVFTAELMGPMTQTVRFRGESRMRQPILNGC